MYMYMYMYTVRRMYPHLHTRSPARGRAPACVSWDKGMVFEFFEFFEFSFSKGEREKENLTQLLLYVLTKIHTHPTSY